MPVPQLMHVSASRGSRPGYSIHRNGPQPGVKLTVQLATKHGNYEQPADGLIPQKINLVQHARPLAAPSGDTIVTPLVWLNALCRPKHLTP